MKSSLCLLLTVSWLSIRCLNHDFINYMHMGNLSFCTRHDSLKTEMLTEPGNGNTKSELILVSYKVIISQYLIVVDGFRRNYMHRMQKKAMSILVILINARIFLDTTISSLFACSVHRFRLTWVPFFITILWFEWYQYQSVTILNWCFRVLHDIQFRSLDILKEVRDAFSFGSHSLHFKSSKNTSIILKKNLPQSLFIRFFVWVTSSFFNSSCTWWRNCSSCFKNTSWLK